MNYNLLKLSSVELCPETLNVLDVKKRNERYLICNMIITVLGETRDQYPFPKPWNRILVFDSEYVAGSFFLFPPSNDVEEYAISISSHVGITTPIPRDRTKWLMYFKNPNTKLIIKQTIPVQRYFYSFEILGSYIIPNILNKSSFETLINTFINRSPLIMPECSYVEQIENINKEIKELEVIKSNLINMQKRFVTHHLLQTKPINISDELNEDFLNDSKNDSKKIAIVLSELYYYTFNSINYEDYNIITLIMEKYPLKKFTVIPIQLCTNNYKVISYGDFDKFSDLYNISFVNTDLFINSNIVKNISILVEL